MAYGFSKLKKIVPIHNDEEQGKIIKEWLKPNKTQILLEKLFIHNPSERSEIMILKEEFR